MTSADCEAPGHDQPAPAIAHSRLCASHRAGIRRDLRRIAILDQEITAALIPADYPGRGAHSTGFPIPVNLDAAQWRDQAAHDLAVITAWTRNERGTKTSPPRRIADMARWLIPHTAWISYRDWAPGAAGTLTETRQHGTRVTGYQPGARALIPLPNPYNTCPECKAPQTLRAILYSLPGDPRECTIRCAACGHAWDPAQWTRLGQRLTRETITP